MDYFKILLFLEKGNRNQFSFPQKEQQSFLDRLGDATNDYERSYKQYLCQNQLVRPKCKILFFNIVGAVALPIILIYYLIKRLFVQKSDIVSCLIEKKGMPEVVPNEVRNKYNPSEDYQNGTSLGIIDLCVVWQMIKVAPLHPFFVFKATMNVARYSHLIYKYTPSIMIQFGEFSFSSSVLTVFCHNHNVKHIDLMHGEKLYYIRDSYFHYDECYVWSEYYKNLLISLKAEPTQFKIAVPPSLKIDDESFRNESLYADYKYYLADYDEKTIVSIVEAMSFARREGKTIKYRPHPRYSNIDLLRKYVSPDEIEMPTIVGIQESVANMGCAVGSYSTVMVQAYFSGKKILLDDVAEKDQYEKLKELKYFLSNEEFDTISRHRTQKN